jgi:hypothetical protein
MKDDQRQLAIKNNFHIITNEQVILVEWIHRVCSAATAGYSGELNPYILVSEQQFVLKQYTALTIKWNDRPKGPDQ